MSELIIGAEAEDFLGTQEDTKPVQTVTNIKERTFVPGTLPTPSGWHILIEPISVEEVTEAGIYLVAEHKRAKEANRYVGRVIAMGAGCYTHNNFGDQDPWCGVGDWVVFSQYTGVPISIRDAAGDVVQLRFIHDKAVIAKTTDPSCLIVNV